MTDGARHDAWSAGDSYEAYMGRWSRRIAALFLDWLAPAPGQDWLDVGCGTGALSAAIIHRCDPNSVLGVEQSDGFAAHIETADAAFDDGPFAKRTFRDCSDTDCRAGRVRQQWRFLAVGRADCSECFQVAEMVVATEHVNRAGPQLQVLKIRLLTVVVRRGEKHTGGQWLAV